MRRFACAESLRLRWLIVRGRPPFDLSDRARLVSDRAVALYERNRAVVVGQMDAGDRCAARLVVEADIDPDVRARAQRLLEWPV